MFCFVSRAQNWSKHISSNPLMISLTSFLGLKVWELKIKKFTGCCTFARISKGAHKSNGSETNHFLKVATQKDPAGLSVCLSAGKWLRWCQYQHSSLQCWPSLEGSSLGSVETENMSKWEKWQQNLLWWWWWTCCDRTNYELQSKSVKYHWRDYHTAVDQ